MLVTYIYFRWDRCDFICSGYFLFLITIESSETTIFKSYLFSPANEEAVVPVSETPLKTIQVLASCHSLVQLDSDIVGDPLEKAILKAADWTLTRGEAVIPRGVKSHPLKIFHRYHFSSTLRRMSVIAGHTPVGSTETRYLASVKGSPEALKHMVSAASYKSCLASEFVDKDGLQLLRNPCRQIWFHCSMTLRSSWFIPT